eukprot:2408958-Amphidinium_carterae.1
MESIHIAPSVAALQATVTSRRTCQRPTSVLYMHRNSNSGETMPEGGKCGRQQTLLTFLHCSRSKIGDGSLRSLAVASGCTKSELVTLYLPAGVTATGMRAGTL